MNRKVREPFLTARTLNFILGVVILILMGLVITDVGMQDVNVMLIFSLASVENFIGATISFSEGKKVRGNIYSIVCAVFLIIALILAMRYFVFV